MIGIHVYIRIYYVYTRKNILFGALHNIWAPTASFLPTYPPTHSPTHPGQMAEALPAWLEGEAAFVGNQCRIQVGATCLVCSGNNILRANGEPLVGQIGGPVISNNLRHAGGNQSMSALVHCMNALRPEMGIDPALLYVKSHCLTETSWEAARDFMREHGTTRAICHVRTPQTTRSGVMRGGSSRNHFVAIRAPGPSHGGCVPLVLDSLNGTVTPWNDAALNALQNSLWTTTVFTLEPTNAASRQAGADECR